MDGRGICRWHNGHERLTVFSEPPQTKHHPSQTIDPTKTISITTTKAYTGAGNADEFNFMCSRVTGATTLNIRAGKVPPGTC